VLGTAPKEYNKKTDAAIAASVFVYVRFLCAFVYVRFIYVRFVKSVLTAHLRCRISLAG